MTRNPANPFESGRAYIADGGLETAMIFHEGFDLPLFASFTLLETEAGRAAMRRYFDRFIDAAAANGAGFLLDTPTWRAGGGWGEKLGRSAAEMDAAVRDAAAFCAEVRAARARPDLPVLINGVVGPAGDGYDPEELMTPASAAAYHRAQVESFVGTEVDLISAVTMTHAEEAIGVASLAQEFDFPFFLSFTVETDGRLPTGELLGRAIERTDEATDGAALFYMVNCAHPDHFPADLSSGADWTRRIGGVRPNASRQSHAELDEAETLDDGDPRELGRMCATLAGRLGGLKVMGGCCGTDHRHVEEMARNWSAHRRLAVA